MDVDHINVELSRDVLRYNKEKRQREIADLLKKKEQCLCLSPSECILYQDEFDVTELYLKKRLAGSLNEVAIDATCNLVDRGIDALPDPETVTRFTQFPDAFHKGSSSKNSLGVVVFDSKEDPDERKNATKQEWVTVKAPWEVEMQSGSDFVTQSGVAEIGYLSEVIQEFMGRKFSALEVPDDSEGDKDGNPRVTINAVERMKRVAIAKQKAVQWVRNDYNEHLTVDPNVVVRISKIFSLTGKGFVLLLTVQKSVGVSPSFDSAITAQSAKQGLLVEDLLNTMQSIPFNNSESSIETTPKSKLKMRRFNFEAEQFTVLVQSNLNGDVVAAYANDQTIVSICAIPNSVAPPNGIVDVFTLLKEETTISQDEQLRNERQNVLGCKTSTVFSGIRSDKIFADDEKKMTLSNNESHNQQLSRTVDCILALTEDGALLTFVPIVAPVLKQQERKEDEINYEIPETVAIQDWKPIRSVLHLQALGILEGEKFSDKNIDLIEFLPFGTASSIILAKNAPPAEQLKSTGGPQCPSIILLEKEPIKEPIVDYSIRKMGKRTQNLWLILQGKMGEIYYEKIKICITSNSPNTKVSNIFSLGAGKILFASQGMQSFIVDTIDTNIDYLRNMAEEGMYGSINSRNAFYQKLVSVVVGNLKKIFSQKLNLGGPEQMFKVNPQDPTNLTSRIMFVAPQETKVLLARGFTVVTASLTKILIRWVMLGSKVVKLFVNIKNEDLKKNDDVVILAILSLPNVKLDSIETNNPEKITPDVMGIVINETIIDIRNNFIL